MRNDAQLPRKFHIEKHYIADPLRLSDLFLLQIGRTHLTRDSVIGPHLHQNWFELTHILDGKGWIDTNGVSVPIRAGEIYLSFPGDVHAIRTDRDHPLKYNFLSFWPDDPAVQAQFEKTLLRYSDPTRRIFTDSDVTFLLGNSIAELLRDDAYSREILSAALRQILWYTLRHFTEASAGEAPVFGSVQELCYQLMNYIGTHLYSMTGLQVLEDYFGYSYSYLSDVFHKTTGETLMQYYTGRRLEAASMLLQERRLSVGEIAELLGYSSVYTFSRAFKQRLGMSPTQYRRQEGDVL